MLRGLLLVLVVSLSPGSDRMPSAAAPAPTSPAGPAPCDADPNYHLLDFWLGDWDVLVAGERAGTNRIEKVLSGCAVRELWRDADGRRGESLFFVPPVARRWKQVWVTDQATAPGGLKEKQLVARFPGGGARFQGEIPLPDGRVILDRTTLTPAADGRVRQVIEISRDGGSTWSATFDAWYVRRDDRGGTPGTP